MANALKDTIERISTKANKAGGLNIGVLVKGNWYNLRSKTEPTFKSGDTIALTYEEREYNGTVYRDIKKWEIKESAPAATTPTASGKTFGKNDPAIQASIQRQNALTNATNFVIAQGDVKGDVDAAKRIIRLAAQLERWVDTGEIPEGTEAVATTTKAKTTKQAKEEEIVIVDHSTGDDSDDDDIDLKDLLKD